jgi:hypothetical protein
MIVNMPAQPSSMPNLRETSACFFILARQSTQHSSCGAEADVFLTRFQDDFRGGDDDTGPPGQLFVRDSKVSVVLGDGRETLKPIKKITTIAPLSKASAVKPPFLSSQDAWLIETQKVRNP